MKRQIILSAFIFVCSIVMGQIPSERTQLLSAIHHNSRFEKPGRIDNDHRQMRYDFKRDHDVHKDRMKNSMHEKKHEKKDIEKHERKHFKREGR
ncbi:MAG: hypothetical protein WCO54_00790 [Bacteroidota bacterium]